MAVFYVLPARPLLGECLARMLRPYVPGVAVSGEACSELVEALVAGSPDGDESYVIHREDLPESDDLNASLRDGFGAEAGDQVVQVSIGARDTEPRVQIWKLKAA
jgi:hypothetical protein